MNYATNIQLASDAGGRKITYTTNHSEQINPGGHSPFTYRALDDAQVHRGVLTVCIYTVGSQYEISPVNAH